MVKMYILFLVMLPKFHHFVAHAYFRAGFVYVLVAYPIPCGHP